MVFTLCGCGEFKVENVESITISCPSDDSEDGKSIMLTPNVHSSDFYEIIEASYGKSEIRGHARA